MGKTIVVYYSRKGNTKKVAEKLASQLKSDIVEITEAKSRNGLFGFIRSGREAMMKRTPPIILPETKWEEYDTFYIGTPIWAGNMASPVRTFLAQNFPKAARYGMFFTSGGPPEDVKFDVAQLTGKEPIVKIGIRDKELKSGNWESILNSCQYTK